MSKHTRYTMNKKAGLPLAIGSAVLLAYLVRHHYRNFLRDRPNKALSKDIIVPDELPNDIVTEDSAMSDSKTASFNKYYNMYCVPGIEKKAIGFNSNFLKKLKKVLYPKWLKSSVEGVSSGSRQAYDYTKDLLRRSYEGVRSGSRQAYDYTKDVLYNKALKPVYNKALKPTGKALYDWVWDPAVNQPISVVAPKMLKNTLWGLGKGSRGVAYGLGAADRWVDDHLFTGGITRTVRDALLTPAYVLDAVGRGIHGGYNWASAPFIEGYYGPAVAQARKARKAAEQAYRLANPTLFDKFLTALGARVGGFNKQSNFINNNMNKSMIKEATINKWMRYYGFDKSAAAATQTIDLNPIGIDPRTGNPIFGAGPRAGAGGADFLNSVGEMGPGWGARPIGQGWGKNLKWLGKGLWSTAKANPLMGLFGVGSMLTWPGAIAQSYNAMAHPALNTGNYWNKIDIQ